MNGIRTDKTCRPHSLDAGFSFVELMVVIVIIVIVATLALMQRGSANEQFQRQNVARELKVALERARFDSVKRRATRTPQDTRATVTVASDGFTLRTDQDQDGILDDDDDQDTSVPTGISIDPAATIYFNRRGEIVALDGSLLPGAVFTVCNGVCPQSDATSPNTATIVVVTATGTVNLLAGGSEVPAFVPPNVQSVPPGTGIRSETYIAP
ncbi:MAG TPA: prepilin-type N-terminal cleavage/methylation domain-containing protein [Pyrinomonadaceae bacterium]|nr:prepilin-type N-terminal cleavage/methylation domain-containing protein [Pyrinomonadaceae bacterium]